MRMTSDEIRSMVEKRIFDRGMDYFVDGKVIDCELKDGILFSQVQGSRRAPYQVKIHFAGKRKPQCECTCPYAWGQMCKHAVAVLLNVSKVEEMPPKLSLARQQKSLIFSDEENVITPILKFTLPAHLNLVSFSKGIKVQLHIIQGKRTTLIHDLQELVNPSLVDKQRTLIPSFNSFNASQQQCLRLMALFSRFQYNGMKIGSFELSLLFKESVGKEGIQFFSGAHTQLKIQEAKKVSVMLDIGYKNSKYIQTSLYIKRLPDSEKLMSGLLVAGQPCWMIDLEEGGIYPLDDVFNERVLTQVFSINKTIELPRSEFPSFVDSVLNPIKDHCTVTYRNQEMEKINVIESLPVIQLYVSGDANELIIKLKCVYQGQSFTLNDLLHSSQYLTSADNQSTWIKRDLIKEKQIIRSLCTDNDFDVEANGDLVLRDMDKIVRFISQDMPQLVEKYEIYYALGFEEKFKLKAKIVPCVHLSAQGLDWFHFDVRYRAQGVEEEFTQADIKRQLMQGKNYIRFKNGDIYPIDLEGYGYVKAMTDEFDEKIKQLPVFHALYLIDEANRKGLNLSFDDSFGQLHTKIKQFRSIASVEPPLALSKVLRDYQRKGLDWLDFLRGFQLGGILADEMGLGKTLQVLALIKNLVDAGEKMPNLVVCPTTLVWNWQAEINKFAPDLKVIVPSGSLRREQITNIKDCQIVITSYALLRRDALFYEKIPFNYIILDEAQNIKNRNTLNARMSKKIKSRHRIVMTGTPMENSIADLWSIFDFLMPGFLGGYERFKKNYEIPILRDQNQGALESLSRKIKPFMLRRLKSEVIKELPQRIEQVSFCELEPTQYKCYEQMLSLARKEVSDIYKSNGFNKGRMKILTIILRLRQICCHPQLANVSLGHRLLVSAKLNLLKEVLQEAISGGHKVLIFSQFIGMLTIISEYLTKEKISFEYMDGSTKNRQEIVERFNASGQIKVFLLSLKVGGVGLNLTSADTVIIFEPWWNPAVEDQAIDRAHRIGQKNRVMAYKFICKGTIEEKIMELQKRKKNIIDSLVISEEGIAKKLGWEDIRFLLGIE